MKLVLIILGIAALIVTLLFIICACIISSRCE